MRLTSLHFLLFRHEAKHSRISFLVYRILYQIFYFRIDIQSGINLDGLQPNFEKKIDFSSVPSTQRHTYTVKYLISCVLPLFLFLLLSIVIFKFVFIPF